jgi:NDP-sugar pyrophosphorylase family protein
MNAILIDGSSDDGCAPITCTRPLSTCQVANRPLGMIQKERLVSAGFSLLEQATGTDLFVPRNAWLSDALLRQLAQLSAPAAVRDASGKLLAWIGDSAQAVLNTRAVMCDTSSFLIRHPWDLLAIQEQVMAGIATSHIEGEISASATQTGILILGKGSRILPGVYLEGTVIIGTNCKIGPNCYLRGFTSIGNDCHIGQAVEVKNSIIMDRTSIGHLSYCGDSIIGSHVNFGAGTITANFRHDGKNHRSMVNGQLVDTGRRKCGTVMGDNVHTGIHTSIYPGRKLWPNVSTLPGDVVKADILT